ncbi:hypothetical protein ACGFX8_36405, partial [Streptomyces sp. NPDC048362]|uniref:hypothetical protein n=1 Tax=Streptomyces sp. NPDC048362 TaxID=3365539 RepID=UPI003713907C
ILGADNIAKTTRAIRHEPERALAILGITNNPNTTELDQALRPHRVTWLRQSPHMARSPPNRLPSRSATHGSTSVKPRLAVTNLL